MGRKDSAYNVTPLIKSAAEADINEVFRNRSNGNKLSFKKGICDIVVLEENPTPGGSGIIVEGGGADSTMRCGLLNDASGAFSTATVGTDVLGDPSDDIIITADDANDILRIQGVINYAGYLMAHVHAIEMQYTS